MGWKTIVLRENMETVSFHIKTWTSAQSFWDSLRNTLAFDSSHTHYSASWVYIYILTYGTSTLRHLNTGRMGITVE